MIRSPASSAAMLAALDLRLGKPRQAIVAGTLAPLSGFRGSGRDVRDWSHDSRARRRLVSWLHDGSRIAYVDDASGYERIAVAPVDQSAPPAYVTDDDAGILHDLAASPAGDRIAFATNRHELWLLDLGHKPRLVDRSVGDWIDDLAFSPDGAWLAYTWSPKAHTTIVRLVECGSGRIIDATSALG